MKKAIIVCASGMSSSVIAQKTTDYFKEKGIEIELEATTVSAVSKDMEANQFDLYLVSPQTKMHYDMLAKQAEKIGKPVVNIPPQAYVPIPMAIEKMAALVEENI